VLQVVKKIGPPGLCAAVRHSSIAIQYKPDIVNANHHISILAFTTLKLALVTTLLHGAHAMLQNVALIFKQELTLVQKQLNR